MRETNSAPLNPHIIFGDALADREQREAVERCLATHVAHSAEAAAQARTAEAERANLVAALQGPFLRQIEQDPQATKALEELRTRQLIELELDERVTPAGAATHPHGRRPDPRPIIRRGHSHR